MKRLPTLALGKVPWIPRKRLTQVGKTISGLRRVGLDKALESLREDSGANFAWRHAGVCT